MLEVNITGQRGTFRLEAAAGFPPGVTALIGSSGAGKSSLLRVIAGLDRPVTGRVVLNGQVWAEGGTRRHLPTGKRHIGMVFQEARLLLHKSVADNIRIGGRGRKVSEQILAETGCDSLLDKPVSGLSGGEQQRVMLARALVSNPQVLLLDEPLSALDHDSREQVTALLADVLPKLDIPVIFVTHSFEDAARLARHFVRMEAGRVVAEGKALEVLSGQGAARQEAAVSSLLQGRVTSVEVSGIARISLGNQIVEAPAGEVQRGQDVVVRLWARDLILALERPKGLSARNCLLGKISGLSRSGDHQMQVEVLIDGQSVSVLVMARTANDMDIRESQPVHLVFKTATLEVSGLRTLAGDRD